MEPPLSEPIFVLLRDLIHERGGVFFAPYQREILAMRLAPRLSESGVDSFLDYFYLLKYGPREEWQAVMNAVTVRETFFWREIDQVQALVHELLPRCLAVSAPLRIWCAACASGEEPLTIAMALDEAGWFARVPIQINASDASSDAINQARMGVYRSHALRALPPRLRERYFTPINEGWRIDPALQQHVNWQVSNVLDEAQTRMLAAAPVVFCRNMLIYFSEQSTRRVVALLAASMLSPGFLCLGAPESLLRASDAFELQEIAGAFVYVRRDRR